VLDKKSVKPKSNQPQGDGPFYKRSARGAKEGNIGGASISSIIRSPGNYTFRARLLYPNVPMRARLGQHARAHSSARIPNN
jgi:hypothetical protein